MPYTEIKERNGKNYYYRVISVRNKRKVGKKRIYLGTNLNKDEISTKESTADKQLIKNKINKNIEKIKPIILSILRKYKIKKAGIFGSYVRGDQKKGSDIDILVKYPIGMGGFKFVAMAQELEDKLEKKIDLVTYDYISPYLKKYILEEEVRIL